MNLCEITSAYVQFVQLNTIFYMFRAKQNCAEKYDECSHSRVFFGAILFGGYAKQENTKYFRA